MSKSSDSVKRRVKVVTYEKGCQLKTAPLPLAAPFGSQSRTISHLSVLLFGHTIGDWGQIFIIDFSPLGAKSKRGCAFRNPLILCGVP